MKKALLRAGVIGLGVGEAHVDALLRNPRCQVIGVCDLNEEKRDHAKSKYGNVLVTANADDILQHDEIDIVVIASYDNYHYEQIIKAVENDKHVFVEKPLCLFEEEAKHIRALLSDKPHIRLSSNLILRKYPRFVSLKKMIDSGEMGRLFYVEGDYNYGRLDKILNGWRGKIDFYSVVYGGGVHIVDLLVWLSGAKVSEVAAIGSNVCSTGSDFRYNDMVVSLLKFDNGLVGKVSANFGCVYPHFHKIFLYGTKMTFENSLNGGMVYESRDPSVMPRRMGEEYPGVNKGELISGFIDAICDGRMPEISEDDVLNTMSVCFAIERSVESRRSSPVTYI